MVLDKEEYYQYHNVCQQLVIMSPSIAGLCQLLHECEKCGTSYEVKCNVKNSGVMILRTTILKDVFFLNLD